MIERTVAGMERAKRAGKVIGRPKKAISLSSVRALRAQGLSVRAVARRPKVPASTLHRVLKRAGEAVPQSLEHHWNPGLIADDKSGTTA